MIVVSWSTKSCVCLVNWRKSTIKQQLLPIFFPGTFLLNLLKVCGVCQIIFFLSAACLYYRFLFLCFKFSRDQYLTTNQKHCNDLSYVNSMVKLDIPDIPWAELRHVPTRTTKLFNRLHVKFQNWRNVLLTPFILKHLYEFPPVLNYLSLDNLLSLISRLSFKINVMTNFQSVLLYWKGILTRVWWVHKQFSINLEVRSE